MEADENLSSLLQEGMCLAAPIVFLAQSFWGRGGNASRTAALEILGARKERLTPHIGRVKMESFPSRIHRRSLTHVCNHCHRRKTIPGSRG